MRSLINFLSIFLCCHSLSAQNSKFELNKKKEDIIKEISQSNLLLKENEENKNYSYNLLITLNSKIKSRRELITKIETELNLIKTEISENYFILSNLKSNNEKLISKYELLIKFTHKNKLKFNNLLNIMSSKSFHEISKKLYFYKKLSDIRKNQIEKIENEKIKILELINTLNYQKKIKKELLELKNKENISLENEKRNQKLTLEILSKKEKEIKNLISEKEKIKNQIISEIEKIIQKEINYSSTSKFKLTPESELLSKSFIKNKGKLPWPVEYGLLVSKFGKHKHPILSGVIVENNGVEIATNKNSVCRSIFDGIVSGIISLPNNTKVVMVRHGNYISVYSNLSKVFVKKKEKLETKSIIGSIYKSDREETSILDFQIWQENKKLNPESWLIKN